MFEYKARCCVQKLCIPRTCSLNSSLSSSLSPSTQRSSSRASTSEGIPESYEWEHWHNGKTCVWPALSTFPVLTSTCVHAWAGFRRHETHYLLWFHYRTHKMCLGVKLKLHVLTWPSLSSSFSRLSRCTIILSHFFCLSLDRDRAPRWNLPNRQGDLLAMKHGVAWQADDSSICMLHHVMFQYTLRGVSFLYRTLSISKNLSIVNLCKTCPTTSRNFCGSIPADFMYSSSKKRSTARCFFGNRLLPLARIFNKATQTHLFQR